MELTLLGLGANLGDPLAQLAAAVDRLRDGLLGLEVSPVYRTEPVGGPAQPDYLNLVCAGWTDVSPHALLRWTQRLERRMGRERPFPDAPRTLDIDLLACGRHRMCTPGLTLPHPRLHRRAFVLVPLAARWPHWRHPRLGCTAAELLRALPPGPRVERLGTLSQLLARRANPIPETGAS